MWLGTSGAASAWPVERSDRLMGTVVSQRAYGIGAARCAALASAELVRLEGLWSVFRPDSEVSELARCAGCQALAIDTDTLAILAAAKEFQVSMLGAFDTTVGPSLTLWRAAQARGSLPAAEEIAAARALLGSCDIELGPGLRARLKRSGQQLDLGAIAKGYAADRCVELYRQAGIRHALLDLGGNVVLQGQRPDGAPWRVGIQAPGRARGRSIGYLEAADCSVVTSGNYERHFEIAGHRYSHIIDPRTGMPVANDALSATVMAASSTFADALATACIVLGVQDGMTLAEALGARALMLDAKGGVHLTSRLQPYFHAA
jgi:thiamine biosynthesis lipoprotein